MAPATFQRAVDIILSGVRCQICLVYLDDVIVFSRMHGKHAKYLDSVLSLLQSLGISLKLNKCSFFQPKVHYLGHVISLGKHSIAEAAADAFKKFNFPRRLTRVRSFVEACNVTLHVIARPLTDMTRKDADPGIENPTELQLEAFEALKERMISPPILVLPRYGRPYMFETDASACQLGCTLLPEHNEAIDWRPVGC